jgi:hypothetical protein
MSRLSELAHWLWTETRLGAPPSMQRTVIPFLHGAKEIARLLVQPCMPLYELRGQNEAGPLTVTYGGLGYAKPMLKNLLFSEEPAEREIGRVLVWRPGELIHSTTNDLTIIESSRHLIRKLPSQSAITLPFRVRFVLDVQGEWHEVEQRFRRKHRRNIRQAQRYECYEYEISRHEQDLTMFYHTMYLPNVQERHGELATILSERKAHQFLRYGWLFLVKRDGVYVCGCLGYVRKGIVEFEEMGVLNGDRQLMREGVTDAMFYLGIRWAHQEGYKAFSFGGSWPYLSGNFQFKRKWGTVVSIPSHEHKQIWTRIQRNTLAVSQFLKSNPCIILDSRGELQGLIVIDDPDDVTSETEAKWRKLYETPGLSGLLVCSVTDLIHSGQCITKSLEKPL